MTMWQERTLCVNLHVLCKSMHASSGLGRAKGLHETKYVCNAGYTHASLSPPGPAISELLHGVCVCERERERERERNITSLPATKG